jgi:hypothetical protein
MKLILLISVVFLLSTMCMAQNYPPATSCPVLATLASSKVRSDKSENLVIWFYNQGTRTTHGVEFTLVMLDGAGNRYPASHRYIGTGTLKPKTGDVVSFSTEDEAKYFGDGWKDIDGVEVYVTSILFADATTWKPKRGIPCKTSFINSDYQKQMEEMDKRVERSMKAWREKWNREHPDDAAFDPSTARYITTEPAGCPTSDAAETYDAQGNQTGAIPNGNAVSLDPRKHKPGFYWVRGVESNGEIISGYIHEGCVNTPSPSKP